MVKKIKTNFLLHPQLVDYACVCRKRPIYPQKFSPPQKKQLVDHTYVCSFHQDLTPRNLPHHKKQITSPFKFSMVINNPNL